jgi:hypothetical protein
MIVLKEKGKESIKHMWQRKRNLLPQRKLWQKLRIMHFKLKIVDLKKDSKWCCPWSLPTQKQKISIHVYF